MNIVKIANGLNGRDIFINKDELENNCILVNHETGELCENVLRQLLNIGRICSNNILELLTEAINTVDYVQCSYCLDFSNTFLVIFDITTKGICCREGKLRIYINSDERNHKNTPHFHCEASGDWNVSIALTGEILAGSIPNSYKKRLERLLTPDNIKKIEAEWERCNPKT